MVGKLWSTGIIVRYLCHDRWAAKVDFRDSGFCQSDSIEGELHARYVGPLSQVVDLVKRDTEALGIEWNNAEGNAPFLYYECDGESEIFPPPDGWREMLKVEAERIGFRTYRSFAEQLEQV